MAISDAAGRLALVNRGRGSVVRKLEGLLPTARGPQIQAEPDAHDDTSIGG